MTELAVKSVFIRPAASVKGAWLMAWSLHEKVG